MSTSKVAPIEKIIAILSYYTMGIIGLIWFIIAYVSGKRVKQFLLFNIIQSMFISILLAILHLVLKIVLSILAVIPFLDFISAQVNFWLSFKIINFIGLSFSVIEFIIFILLAYIVLGVLLGRIFYLPLLTNIVKKIVNRYN